MWRALLSRRMLVCVLIGFSSGMPLYLLLNLVPAWLKTEGIALKAIGLFALIQFPYTWKFLWAPLLDRYAMPVLGRRRGWMALMQLGLVGAIAWFGAISPKGLTAPAIEWVPLIGNFISMPMPDWASVGAFVSHPVTVGCLLIALFSATQDIALDAFRREMLREEELGLGNAVFVNAYRIAGLVPGSLSLILADRLPWSLVFWITALFMLPGLITSLVVREPAVAPATPRTLREAVVEPFHEFMTRHGWVSALTVLAFIFLYKLGDSMCTALATPFYLEMGYTKSDIGLIAKHAGLWPAVIGGLLGGMWMVKLGINRALWIFGVVQLVSIFGFAALAALGAAPADAQRLTVLALVIGVEALGVGLGTAAFVAFISRTTNPAYTATQFALFTSLAAVPRTFVNAGTGWIVEALGWLNFFGLCALLAVPGMLLLFKVAPWNGEQPASDAKK